MPSCLLNLTQEVLTLLPSPIVSNISEIARGARNKADEVTKDIFRKLMLDSGIIEFDTEEGVFKFISNSSKAGLDSGEGSVLNQIGGFLTALNATTTFGGRLYSNYQAGRAQIEEPVCIFCTGS